MKKYKVIIIGSGIAGMTAAIYLKRGGISPLIIENNAPGGVLNLIDNIQNYPGYESISGPDLAFNIYKQVQSLNIDMLFKSIDKIDLNNKIINDEIMFDYLIIATGRRHRMLNLENESKYIGKGISTCALCDGSFYKDKEVVVVGGGSTAISESLYLATLCKKVTIIHRRDYFSSEEYLINKLNNTKNIKVIYNTNVIKYNIKNDRISGVTLDNNKKVKASGIFLAIGSIPNSELFDVNKDNGYILVSDNYETNVMNVFAIGDVIKKKYYQLTTATADATICASNIINRIN